MKHMKKLIALALVAITVLAISVPAMAATVTRYVQAPQGPGWTVRIRKEPKTTAATLISPTHGSAIYVSANNGTWSTVTYRNPVSGITYNGYMQSQYLVSSIPLNTYWIVRYGTIDHKLTSSVKAGCANLQTDLNTYFSKNGGSSYSWYPLAVDGICGYNSVAAIRRFQELNGLIVDGVAGNRTKEYLYKLK